jgi:hypothetical protein
MKKISLYDYYEFKKTTQIPEKPFTPGLLRAVFTKGHRSVMVNGFYDGEGTFCVRFMADSEGEWHYKTQSELKELDGLEDRFLVQSAKEGNHGPVRVRDTYHFIHEDGTPHLSFGTTCYAWVHQSKKQQELTLDTLSKAPFNKIRMCIFPKWYPFNRVEPEEFPFVRNSDSSWDFTSFNPVFFRNLEKRIGQLRDLGIEADLILFHPYDENHWGFDRMPAHIDDSYLHYIVARLSAYSNVWWSLANEFDLLEKKSMADWNRFFRIIQEEDPYHHLRSIHNCREFYDHTHSWVTHGSIQRSDLTMVRKWRDEFKKPIVVDECCYEGDIRFNWGNLTPEQMVDQFWTGVCNGGYVGHGETYRHDQDLLWWSKGGELRGKSPERITFMRKLLEEDLARGYMSYLSAEPAAFWNDSCFCFYKDQYFLSYQRRRQPGERELSLPENHSYFIDLIDCWNMTVERLDGEYKGKALIQLPGKPMYCIRAVRSDL